MTRKFSPAERAYWSGVFVSCSQVTFALMWGSLFVPLDQAKPVVLLLNMIITVVLLFWGWLVIKRR